MKKKVMLIFGTRPEAIKMCPVVLALKAQPELFETKVVDTGQHKEMLKPVLSTFGVTPDYDLDIMQPGQTLFDITIRILDRLQSILEVEKPDVLLVHGDTSTSFAAAVAGFYSGVKLGHVEAGLRTHNLRSPWPEEFNRQAVDLISDWYFAPTDTAKQHLLAEGKKASQIYVTGNTSIDALRYTVRPDYDHSVLDWAAGSRLILLTAHRRENLGDPMRHMFRAIRRVVDEFTDVRAIFPVHLNPLVREIAQDELGSSDKVRLVDPMDVLDFHNILSRSHIVLTDSGGIQEEAPGLGKPVLVMRDTTERPEGVEAGTLKLVGTDEDVIYSEFKKLLTDDSEYMSMAHASNPYGDGCAAERIVKVLSYD